MLEERAFQWKPVLWAATVIFVLSNVLVRMVPTIYGIYIGFQSRGDMELVNLGVESLVRSPAFAIYFYLVPAGISLWRGFVLAREVPTRVGLHLGVAGTIAAVLPLLLAFVAGDGLTLIDLGSRAITIFGGIYLGAYLGQRQTAVVAA